MGAKAAAVCPDENLLVSLIEGRLADEEVRALESHIDVCASCESVFGELAAVMAPSADSARPANDVLIGRYQIIGEVGAGAMGVVYAALDPELGRKVAIKLLRPDLHGAAHLSQARARLLREARLLAGLSHPNVLHVYEAGAAGDQVFIAVELIEGRSFDAWQRELGPHPWRSIARVYAQAARGLSAAHRAGLVHRDVKPANFMLGDDGRVRVTDFGLATAGLGDGETSGLRPSSRAETALKTASGAIVGTPAYMAPEQFAGRKVDARSDQFSFCVALAEALTGERPTAGSTADDLVEASLNDGERTAPRPLLEIVERGLRARPADRFESMEALIAEVEALLADDGHVSASPAPAPAVTSPPPARGDAALEASLEDRSSREVSPPSRTTRRGRYLAVAAVAGLASAAVLAAALVYVEVQRARVDRAPVSPVASATVPEAAVPDATQAPAPPSPTPASSEEQQGEAGVDAPAPLAPLPAGPVAPGSSSAAASGPSAAPAGQAWSEEEIDLAVDVRRLAENGNGTGCLTKFSEIGRDHPALASRPDLVVVRAQCEQLTGNCEAGKKILSGRLSGSYSGDELARAVDASSIAKCRANKAPEPGNADFDRRLAATQKLVTSANEARAARDTKRCREIASEVNAFGQKEKISSDARLRQSLFAASAAATMCLAEAGDEKSCAAARVQWKTNYKAMFPEIIAGGFDDASIDAVFAKTFPSCK